MVFYRYMVDRKLPSSESSEYRYRKPMCQVCGGHVLRVAIREPMLPYAWLPTGWMCVGCSIIDMDGVV
jgi:hypothetical protein